MDDLISRQAAIDAIDTEGLDEQIRCEMCRNPMHTYRGCDGNCKYDEKLYKRIMQILDERIKPLPSAQPDKEKISDALYHIYRNKGTSTSAEGVAAIKYYIAEIWREIYGEEGPTWLKK